MIKISKITGKNDRDHCFHIRTVVFVEEQNVPLNEEMDGLDDDADHYLLWQDDTPIATARVRYLGGTAKIERVALLKGYRGRNIGLTLMEYIIEDIRSDLQKSPKVTQLKLGAQIQVIPFYEKLGFISHGDDFLDAGITHRWMTRKIS